MPSSGLSDRLLAALRENRFIAVVVAVATILAAVATFTTTMSTAFEKACSLLGLGGQDRVIYRQLAADLENLDKEVAALGAQTSKPYSGWDNIRIYVHWVDVAAEPVCNARPRISALGDTETRNDLDGICKAVQVIDALDERTAGVGATALAATLQQLGVVKRVREKLRARTKS
jgi:Flp pilus assembly pilin Flp